MSSLKTVNVSRIHVVPLWSRQKLQEVGTSASWPTFPIDRISTVYSCVYNKNAMFYSFKQLSAVAYNSPHTRKHTSSKSARAQQSSLWIAVKRNAQRLAQESPHFSLATSLWSMRPVHWRLVPGGGVFVTIGVFSVLGGFAWDVSISLKCASSGARLHMPARIIARGSAQSFFCLLTDLAICFQ